MARPLHIEYPGAVYHITSRGNEKKPVYKDEQDRKNFLFILDKVNKRYHWLCHAYCLMDNHFHLLIETPEGNLSFSDYLGGHQDVAEIPKSQRYATRPA